MMSKDTALTEATAKELAGNIYPSFTTKGIPYPAGGL